MAHGSRPSAPLVVFAYKRPVHLARTLAALQNNLLSKQTNLFIYIDGPRSSADVEAVCKTKDMCQGLRGFASVTVNASEINKGLAASIIAGVSDVMKRFGKVIVLEDDIITTPYFLTYMNDALEYYEHDPYVFSIGGYSYPQNIFSLPKNYTYDTYVSYRCCSWGWACWADRWNKVDWSMAYFDDFMKDIKAQQEFNRSGPDMTSMLQMQHRGAIDSWAIRFCYAHHENHMHCIYPVYSLGNNIGLDNSGVHCKEGDERAHVSLNMDWRPTRFCPGSYIVPAITKSFYNVFAAPEAQLPWEKKIRKIPGIQKLKTTLAWRIARKVKYLFKTGVVSPDVLFVNTTQKDGGAARAAWRLFQGVNAHNPNTRYFTFFKEDHALPDGVHQSSLKALLAREFSRLDRCMLKLYPQRSQEIFSPAVCSNFLRQSFRPFKPTIVHLHWVAGSMLRPSELLRFNAPIVWTLHDTWAFTGGCHYTGTCTGFMRQCGCCPVLGSAAPKDLSHKNWLRKSKVYTQLDLTIVTPSRWLAGVARESALLRDKHIKVIPNGLDQTVYRPVAKEIAKGLFGFISDSPIIAFGAQAMSDPRKGMGLLIAALEKVTEPHNLLTFGEGAVSHNIPACLEHKHMGTLHDDISLSMLYSAADVFICPSREDNLPNTVAEALSCGTPCVAFAQGGLPEMIRHKETGWLAAPFEVDDLAAGITHIVSLSDKARMQEAARAFAVKHYDLNIITKKYLELYERCKVKNNA